MAKRARDAGGSVNLFPFLSILICIIGCLTLIIVVINLIAMSKGEGRTSEEVERAQEYVELKRIKEEKQEAMDEIKLKIEVLIQQNKDSLAARDKLTVLKDMLDNQEDIEKSREELIAKYNILVDTNKKLVADEKFLQEEIVKKEEEIAKRKLPPEEAELVVRSTGSSANTRPHFAEISDRGVYIHTSLSGEPLAIPIASLGQSEEFIALLDKVAAEPYNTLIFLVRGSPGAVATLNQAGGLISAYNQSRGTKIVPGKLPLPGEGKIDLRSFAQFLEP